MTEQLGASSPEGRETPDQPGDVCECGHARGEHWKTNVQFGPGPGCAECICVAFAFPSAGSTPETPHE